MSLFGGSATSSTSTAAANAQGDLSKDVELSSPPEDSISDIAFSSKADLLAVSSWDKKVRIYEIDGNGQSQGKCFWEHDQPVLSVAWSSDGTKAASGSADKAAKLCDIATGQAQQVAAHDAAIRCVKFIQPSNQNGSEFLVTGSWDKTIKYWDLRQQAPITTLNMQERVYTLDVQQDLMVVGLAERYLDIVNLTNPGTVFKTMQSPLKWQTRVVSCFSDATGFAVGSIEGRCAIQYVDEKQQNSNFSFKCHRGTQPTSASTPTDVYSVNAISFHPVFGTFSTAGSDGTFHFWDKDAKHRLKGYPSVGAPITATTFNQAGTIFAYAVSYDWSKGHQGNSATHPNKIMLHPIKEDEAKPRQPPKKR